jgi:hypothetical protein
MFSSEDLTQKLQTMKQKIIDILKWIQTFISNHKFYIFLSPLVAAGLGYIVYQSYFSSRFRNSHIEKEEKFDFIIVGSGAAGAVLANRLSENPKTKVLVLEAGGTDNILEVKLPAAFAKLFKTDADWKYFTEEQKNCLGRKLFWPRGKMLGGSSNMNAMIYHRCHSSDFDAYAKENKGWSYEEVLPC